MKPLLTLILLCCLSTAYAQGAINPQTGEYYPDVGSGVINPQTGEFFPNVGKGYVNPRNGTYFQGIAVPRPNVTPTITPEYDGTGEYYEE